MRRLMTATALCTLLFAACGGNKAEPDKGVQPDVIQPDVLSPFDTGPTACGAGIYPCGPYGTAKGTVAANLEFVGFKDPQEQCKANKDKVLDLDNKVKIAFKDWHLGDTACAKKGLLWVVVSAGWCRPCKVELCKTVRDYQAGAVDSRVGILNIVFETDDGKPVTEDFLKLWITNLPDPDTGKRCLAAGRNLSLPVVMDPSFRMGVYFNKAAVPFNMLIDTSTMKIYWQDVGEKLPEIGQQIANFFK